MQLGSHICATTIPPPRGRRSEPKPRGYKNESGSVEYKLNQCEDRLYCHQELTTILCSSHRCVIVKLRAYIGHGSPRNSIAKSELNMLMEPNHTKADHDLKCVVTGDGAVGKVRSLQIPLVLPG